MGQQFLGSAGVAAALEDLRSRAVNYDPARAPLDGRPDGHWHVDSASTVLGRERPGPPVPGGTWQSACTLVRRYEFTDPRVVRRLGPVLRAVAGECELVLVNDGSRDKSWVIIRKLAAENSWVRGINLMRNYGQHNALLCGIRAARCETGGRTPSECG